MDPIIIAAREHAAIEEQLGKADWDSDRLSWQDKQFLLESAKPPPDQPHLAIMRPSLVRVIRAIDEADGNPWPSDGGG